MSVFTYAFVLVLSVVRLDLSILLVLECVYYLVQTYTLTQAHTCIYTDLFTLTQHLPEANTFEQLLIIKTLSLSKRCEILIIDKRLP